MQEWHSQSFNFLLHSRNDWNTQISHPWHSFRCHPNIWEICVFNRFLSEAKETIENTKFVNAFFLHVCVSDICLPEDSSKVARIGGFLVQQKRL